MEELAEPLTLREQAHSYIERNTSIRAIQWTGRNAEAVLSFSPNARIEGDTVFVGKRKVKISDYICLGESFGICVQGQEDFDDMYIRLD